MVVVVIKVKDVAMGEDDLITTIIMVVIHQIFTNPYRMRRNKKMRRIYTIEIPRR